MSNKIQIPNGIVYLKPASVAVGGKSTKTQHLKTEKMGEEDQGRKTETKQIVIIADVQERTSAEGLKNKANNMVKAAACRFEFMGGYLCSKTVFEKVQASLRLFEEREVAPFNETAKTCHVEISIKSFVISYAINSDLAEEIAEQIRTGLAEILETINQCVADKAMDTDKIRNGPALRARGMEQLAVGVVQTLIKDALASVGPAIAEIKTARAANREAKPLLGALETAIEYVTSAAPVSPSDSVAPEPEPVGQPAASALSELASDLM